MATRGATIDSGCGECGVEIRADSVFCYNCGKSVAVGSPDNGLDTRLKDVHEKLKKPVRSTEVRTADDVDGPGLNGDSHKRTPETKTAAPGQPLKKRNRRPSPKRGPKDVVWQTDDGPGITYLLVVLAIVVLVALLLALAYYLK